MCVLKPWWIMAALCVVFLVSAASQGQERTSAAGHNHAFEPPELGGREREREREGCEREAIVMDRRTDRGERDEREREKKARLLASLFRCRKTRRKHHGANLWSPLKETAFHPAANTGTGIRGPHAVDTHTHTHTINTYTQNVAINFHEKSTQSHTHVTYGMTYCRRNMVSMTVGLNYMRKFRS